MLVLPSPHKKLRKKFLVRPGSTLVTWSRPGSGFFTWYFASENGLVKTWQFTRSSINVRGGITNSVRDRLVARFTSPWYFANGYANLVVHQVSDASERLSGTRKRKELPFAQLLAKPIALSFSWFLALVFLSTVIEIGVEIGDKSDDEPLASTCQLHAGFCSGCFR